jgi:hypothetical protein
LINKSLFPQHPKYFILNHSEIFTLLAADKIFVAFHTFPDILLWPFKVISFAYLAVRTLLIGVAIITYVEVPTASEIGAPGIFTIDQVFVLVWKKLLL